MDSDSKWVMLLVAVIFLIIGTGVTISQYNDHLYRVKCLESKGQLIVNNGSPMCQFPGK